MKRKLLMIIFGISLLLTGCCAEEINRETTSAIAKVESVKYHPMWMQPLYINKMTTFITHPADWDTIINHNGVSYNLDNTSIYNYCLDKIGEEVTIELLTIYYDDGTTYTEVISVGGIKE